MVVPENLAIVDKVVEKVGNFLEIVDTLLEVGNFLDMEMAGTLLEVKLGKDLLQINKVLKMNFQL